MTTLRLNERPALNNCMYLLAKIIITLCERLYPQTLASALFLLRR